CSRGSTPSLPSPPTGERVTTPDSDPGKSVGPPHSLPVVPLRARASPAQPAFGGRLGRGAEPPPEGYGYLRPISSAAEAGRALPSATRAGRSSPSTSITISEVMRTPLPSTSSTFLMVWVSRMREPAGTVLVKRTLFEP